MNTFDTCKGISEDAVGMAIPMLQTIGDVRLVEAGSHLTTKLQKTGVDLMVWVNRNTFYTVEVKGASKTYPCMLVETIADTKTQEPGWYPNINPDLFLWVYVDTGRSHLLYYPEFKIWCDANMDRYPTVHQGKYRQSRDTVCVKIPWADIALGVGEENFGTFWLDTGWDKKLLTMGLLN